MVHHRRVRLAAATLVAACCAGVCVAVSAPHAAASDVPGSPLSLPAPSGPFRIGTVSLHLVDRSRADPYVPAQHTRQLMISIWYPARSQPGRPTAAYMPAAAAAHYAVQHGMPPSAVAGLRTHAEQDAPALPHLSGRPLVVFSPGLGLNRSSATALVEQWASEGFIVVTIDHTHDAAEVQFPDGHLELGTLPGPGHEAQMLAVRVADERFVLDQLDVLHHGRDPDADHHPIPANLAGALDLCHIAVVGHSFGGATAAETAYEDHRVTTGVDLDGDLYGPVVDHGLDRPFLLMSSEANDRVKDPAWATFWTHLRGPHLDLKLDHAGHFSYTDASLFLTELGLLQQAPPDAIEQLFGTIDPVRAITVQRAYLDAWLHATLQHRPQSLLIGPSPRYPEIEFQR